ncbi:hypothetical protein KAFR_0K01670 [Kazachstania africana CBS 2517]|uniref:Mediator of RNA polymerase II transcription subunit 18 n=1 Tax=Kazachstania africana (strain ATCC 22294 / BCRC 22015 / CBS 2517 / CECT 1963 / NBRC 1671 / NRRL Y-8276) TaxID=1071382 RepID=H2B1M1_KAZAF|nr:hypothetical protein KAFR_0K01670 [Kazachstania africana CBS 2517]CCF60521.1 hypothetical protein KAFR_0K01670 [Kazachstania africana CBS 2517]
MVQQLSLFGAIDDDSYSLFVSTITTLSGNPPILFARLSTIWKPNPEYEINNTNSKNQLVEKARINVSKTLSLNSFNLPESEIMDYNLLKTLPNDENTGIIDSSRINEILQSKDLSAWSFAISDIPASASSNNRKVSVQNISETVLLSSTGSSSNLTHFMNELAYVSEFKYVTIGIKFNLKHNLIIELQKIWNVNDENSNTQITKGGFLIKAFINVAKATDVDKINHNESVLLNLQKELQGYVNLSIPDRSSMDSRMAYDI